MLKNTISLLRTAHSRPLAPFGPWPPSSDSTPPMAFPMRLHLYEGNHPPYRQSISLALKIEAARTKPTASRSSTRPWQISARDYLSINAIAHLRSAGIPSSADFDQISQRLEQLPNPSGHLDKEFLSHARLSPSTCAPPTGPDFSQPTHHSALFVLVIIGHRHPFFSTLGTTQKSSLCSNNLLADKAGQFSQALEQLAKTGRPVLHNRLQQDLTQQTASHPSGARFPPNRTLESHADAFPFAIGRLERIRKEMKREEASLMISALSICWEKQQERIQACQPIIVVLTAKP